MRLIKSLKIGIHKKIQNSYAAAGKYSLLPFVISYYCENRKDKII